MVGTVPPRTLIIIIIIIFFLDFQNKTDLISI